MNPSHSTTKVGITRTSAMARAAKMQAHGRFKWNEKMLKLQCEQTQGKVPYTRPLPDEIARKDTYKRRSAMRFHLYQYQLIQDSQIQAASDNTYKQIHANIERQLKDACEATDGGHKVCYEAPKPKEIGSMQIFRRRRMREKLMQYKEATVIQDSRIQAASDKLQANPRFANIERQLKEACKATEGGHKVCYEAPKPKEIGSMTNFRRRRMREKLMQHNEATVSLVLAGMHSDTRHIKY